MRASSIDQIFALEYNKSADILTWNIAHSAIDMRRKKDASHKLTFHFNNSLTNSFFGYIFKIQI